MKGGRLADNHAKAPGNKIPESLVSKPFYLIDKLSPQNLNGLDSPECVMVHQQAWLMEYLPAVDG